MNYRMMSDREVVSRAETLDVIPQDLAHELLHRLRRSGSSKGEREGSLIIATHWFTGTTDPLTGCTYTGRLPRTHTPPIHTVVTGELPHVR
jgi:hypothetical protein